MPGPMLSSKENAPGSPAGYVGLGLPEQQGILSRLSFGPLWPFHQSYAVGHRPAYERLHERQSGYFIFDITKNFLGIPLLRFSPPLLTQFYKNRRDKYGLSYRLEHGMIRNRCGGSADLRPYLI